jgi:hypothetical protein
VLTHESFKLSMEVGLILICAGLSVGVVFASTILWATTAWQIIFRFFRTLVMASVVILSPFWYPYAAVLFQTFTSGL